MGWRCDKCGNTEDFTEVNTVTTQVNQEKGSTKILKIRNSYRSDGALNTWCNRCDSEEVSWIEVPNQDEAFLK
jgi:DNA-directed RNA polymerase subunit M/transcription elongation factor TFIIS